jgi:hypothetical protein
MLRFTPQLSVKHCYRTLCLCSEFHSFSSRALRPVCSCSARIAAVI